MVARLLRIFKITCIILICLYSAVYLAASTTPFINSISCKYFTYLALGFPYLFIGMILVFIASIFFVKKYWWVFLLVLFTGYKNIYTTTAFNVEQKELLHAPLNSIRLLSWNVNEFVDCRWSSDFPNNPRRRILSFIKQANADVLCLQDFKDFPNSEGAFSNIKYIKDSLGYQYYYFSKDYSFRTTGFGYDYGAAIFSRFPIIDTGRTAYNWPHYPEHIQFADIKAHGQTLRFYNTHLRSMNLKSYTKEEGGDYSLSQDDTAVIFHSGRFKKLQYFDSLHVEQSKVVKTELNKSIHPFVFCSDLNSVPSSYVYHHISKGLNDPFIQHGFGWGATYDGLTPTIRIDVVLTSKQLTTTQYYSPKIYASDHFPIVTDIQFR